MKDIQNIKIREAKRSDIAEVGRILSENYHDTYANILDKRYLSSVNPESAASRMDAYFLAPGNEMFVAELLSDGEEAGAGRFRSGHTLARCTWCILA